MTISTWFSVVSRGLSTLVLIGLFSALPTAAEAATQRPSCELIVVTAQGQESITDDGDIFVPTGGYVIIIWEGKDALRAEGPGGTTVPLFGGTFDFPREDKTYTYDFSVGSRNISCEVTVHVGAGSIDASSLNTSAAKPTLTGTAVGLNDVRVTVRKPGTTKVLFASSDIAVHGGTWKSRITKTLPSGTYEVTLSGPKNMALSRLAVSTLTVGSGATSGGSSSESHSTVAVASVPLLSGGSVRAGQSVPVAYLQVTNTGRENAVLQGFWLSQQGSAPTNTLAGLTTIDDAGMVRGSTNSVSFSGGRTLAPAAMTLLPGQMRLFTIKATLGASASSNYGRQLILDVTGVNTDDSVTGAFPIRGTVWSIIN